MERRGQHQEILRSFNRKNMVIYPVWGVEEWECSMIALNFLA